MALADKLISYAGLQEFKTQQDAVNANKFVEKVTGKDLSENDFTTALKTKLEGIADGAEVNVIEKVTIDGTEQTITGKSVALDLSDYAKKSDIASVFNYKGSKATYAEVTALTGAVKGDVWNVEQADANNGIKAGDNVVYDGANWDVLAGTVDLSGYVQKDGNKVLSEVNFTAAYETKLNGISAEANKVEVTQTIQSGTELAKITIDGVDTALYFTPTQVEVATTAEVAQLF